MKEFLVGKKAQEKRKLTERARIRWTVRACHGQKYTSSSEFTTKREAEAKYEELINEPGTDMIELCMVSTDPELIPSGTERMTFKRNGGIDYYMAVKSQRQKALNPEEFDTKLIDVSESVDTMNESWLKAQKMDLELPTWKFDRKNIRTEAGRNFQEAKTSNGLNFKDLTRVTEGTANYRECDGDFPIVIFEADESAVLDDDASDSWEIQDQYDMAIEDFETLEKEMAIGDLGAWDVRLEDGYYYGLQVLVKDKDEYGDYSEEERAKETEKVNEFLNRLVKDYGWQKIKRVASFSNGETIYEPIREAKLTENSKDPYKLAKKYNLNVFELQGIDVSNDPVGTTYIAIAPDHRVSGSWTICLTDTEEIKAYQKYHQNGNWLVAVHKPFQYYEDACDWLEQNIDRNDTLEGDPVLSESKLREADSDYIKIGNKVYPNTTADPGNMSVDAVLAKTKKAYDQEQAEKEEAARRAKLEKTGAETLEKIKADLKGVESLDDRFSVLFNHLVPKSGKADTVAGELVRAMMKILYRDYNDGDVFYDGYGKETCGPCAAFICDALPDFESEFVHIAENTLEDDEYTQALNQITEELFDYIMDNSYLLAEPNDQDMYDFDGDYFDEYVQTLEYDPDFSGDIEEYIRYDKISWEDVMDELSMFLDNLGIDSRKINQWARDAFTIEDLSPSEFKQIEDEFPDFLRSYLDDLESQYGSVYELDEEEEEEDENEEEGLNESKMRESTGSQEEDDIRDWVQNTMGDWMESWFQGYNGCSQAAIDLMSAKDWFLRNMDEFNENYGYELDSDADELISYIVDSCIDETIDYLEDSSEKFTHLRQMIMDGNPNASSYDNKDFDESKNSRRSKLKESVSGLKITNVSVEPKWIYDTFKGSIKVKATINGKEALFSFGAARSGNVFFAGVDCNAAIVFRKGEEDIPSYLRHSRNITISHGGTQTHYALQIYASTLKSAPKENQKDFRFAGQNYSTKPVKDVFRQKLEALYQDNDLTQEFLDYFEIPPYGTAPASKSSDSVEKMKKWQSGERGFNLKAASDTKLKANLKICREIGFDEGADKIQAELDSRKAQLTESKVYVLYSKDNFQGKKPIYGLKEMTRGQARKLLNEEVQKSGRSAFRQWRITEKACKPEYAYKYSESIGKLLNESEGSERVHGTWNQVLDGLEDWGYYIPESYRKEKPEQWITCRKGDQEYEAEVTKYSDGEYELMKHNVNCIGCLNEKKLNKKQKDFKLEEARAKRSFRGYDPDETFRMVADEGRDDSYFHPLKYYLNNDDLSDLRQKYANKLRKARADYAEAHPEYQDEYDSLMKWQSEASRKRSSARKEDPELAELAKKIADAERYSNYARKKGWWSTVKKQDALRDQLEQELEAKEKAYYNYYDPESRIYKTRPAAEHIDAYWALEDPIIDEYIKERDQQEQEFADALKDKKIYLGQIKGDDGKYHKSFFRATDDPEVFKRIGSRGRTSHPYGPNRGYSEFHIAPDARTEYEDVKAEDIEDLKEYPDPHKWEYDGCYDSTD